MEVVGNGFVARHLRAHFGEKHPEVIAIAAGVSSTSVRDDVEFLREQDLVKKILDSAVRDQRRVVFFSSASSAVYGAVGCPGTEDGPVGTASPYGRHKLGLEVVVRASSASTVVLRVSHLVGPDQRDHQLLPALVRQILVGRVRVQGGAHRDLLDVAHLATILQGVLRVDDRDLLVNACTGTAQPIEAVVAGLETRLGVRAVHDVIAGGDRVVASTARLRSLVPEVADLGFGPGYLGSLLDRYVPAVVASTRGHRVG